MSITVSVEGDEEVIRVIGLTPKILKKASVSAIRKVSGEYRSKTGRGIAKKHGIKIPGFRKKRAIRKTKKLRISRQYPFAHIFSGHNEVKAKFLKGKPRQNDRGVKVGRYFFPHAFIAKMPSGKELVLRRVRKSTHDSKNIPLWVKIRFVHNLPIDEEKIVLPQADATVIRNFEGVFPKLKALTIQKIQVELNKLN